MWIQTLQPWEGHCGYMLAKRLSPPLCIAAPSFEKGSFPVLAYSEELTALAKGLQFNLLPWAGPQCLSSICLQSAEQN